MQIAAAFLLFPSWKWQNDIGVHSNEMLEDGEIHAIRPPLNRKKKNSY